MHRTHAALSLLVLLATACGGAAQSAPPVTEKQRTVPVRTAAVTTRDMDDVVVLTGTLRPRAQVQVVAAPCW